MTMSGYQQFSDIFLHRNTTLRYILIENFLQRRIFKGLFACIASGIAQQQQSMTLSFFGLQLKYLSIFP